MFLNKHKLELIPCGQKVSTNSLLTVNDGHLLDSERVGNFEWWYFDCIDIAQNCMLKIVVHLGTDPLRKSFFPTLALSIKTPEVTRAIELRYDLKDFHADKNLCDLWLKHDCHIFEESENSGIYHIDINCSEFSASLIFKRSGSFWVPPAYKLKAHKGNRNSEFFWNVPQPKAFVDGSFEYNNISYSLNGAIGYHDHNYWQLNPTRGLFMDEVITRWYWGKCVAGPYTVIFMETSMKGITIRAIMVSEHDLIVYQTDKNITISVDKVIVNAQMKSKYPSRITIRVDNEDFPLKMVLTCKEMIESKDLLKGVNPFISWLVKSFVARPSYYGISCTAELEIPDQKLNGFGTYESVNFRER